MMSILGETRWLNKTDQVGDGGRGKIGGKGEYVRR